MSYLIPGRCVLRDRFTGKEDQEPDFGVPSYTDFGARIYSPKAATHLVRGVTKGAEAARAVDKAVDAGRVTGTISKTESATAHMRRGRESEARVLNDMGLSKNTTPYTVKVEGKDVTTIPDSMQGGVYEVKDTKSVYNTQQIKAERQLAEDKGVTFSVFVGEKTHVSTNISSGELIRRKDLGPK